MQLDPKRHAITSAAAAALILLLASPAFAARGGNGGGGGGGDTGGSIRYDYEALPDPTGLDGYPPFAQAVSPDRTWIAGHAGRSYPCATSYAPTLWEDDSTVGWLAHELPHPDDLAGYGYAETVLDGGTAVGWDFEYAGDCTLVRNRPLLWEPEGSGVWSALVLPTPTADGGAALDAALVDGAGLVIVGNADHALLWRQVSGVWTVEDLGGLGGDSTARGVNEAGAVVGTAFTADTPAEPQPFIIVPEDTDMDGVPDTWFRDDSPADGVNDLMQLMGSTGQAWDVNSVSASCGDAPLASVWESDGVGGWSETPLPTGTFTDDTDAYALNDSFQAVGNGTRPKGRSVEARATLWERDGSGAWSVTDLNDVTELPSGTTLTGARGVSVCGDIVTNARNRDGMVGAVLKPRTSPCD